MSRIQDKLRVLIAGGGVAALEAALALRSLAEERVAIQLIAPEPHFWYRPLSVLQPFGGTPVQPLELADLARECGADFEVGALASVDAVARVAHTAAGTAFRYDALVIACGARPRDALPGAFTFRGPGDSAALATLVDEVGSDGHSRLVFAVPAGATWPLPLYELAFLTAAHFAAHDVRGVEIAFVTPEETPLALLGAEASSAIARMLEERGIATHLGRTPLSVDRGTLSFIPAGSVPADRVVSLPRLEGRAIPGVPYDSDGFTPTDAHGRVIGLADVYAAGDVTAFPVKQGGLAAQQADAVAETIAAEAGAPVTPQPFRPVLQGLLLTGGGSIAGGAVADTSVTPEALWWPPGKIVGRYLTPFLAEKANVTVTPLAEAHGALPIQVEL